MSIPAPNTPDAIATVLGLLGQTHEAVRHEIRDLDAAGLNWVPAAGANSIATIVTHLVGSEAETLRTVAGVDSRRDRDAEFEPTPRDPLDALAELEGADLLLAELAPRIDEHRLHALCSLPTLAAGELRSGL